LKQLQTLRSYGSFFYKPIWNFVVKLPVLLGAKCFNTECTPGALRVQPLRLQTLGYGFCPVTEEIKYVNLMDNENSSSFQRIRIDDLTFLIPTGIKAFANKTSRFRRLTFFDKDELQTHMETSYGIEAGMKLIVSASLDGKWTSSDTKSINSSMINFSQEICLVTLKIDNVEKQVTNQMFLQELNSLPADYRGRTAATFRRFFSKWGTHIIYEVVLGGAFQLKCRSNKKSLTKNSLWEIEGEVSGKLAKIIPASGNFGRESNSKNIESSEIAFEIREIIGGNPPPLLTVDSLNFNQLQEWAGGVSINPAELRQTIKLCPYYNFLDGPQSDALREATKEYMCGSLNSRCDSACKSVSKH